MKAVLLGLALLILVSGCTSQVPAEENQQPNLSEQTKEPEVTEPIEPRAPTEPGAKLNLFGQPGCEDKDAILSMPPIALDRLELIDPQGRVAGSHVTPTDHQYWFPIGAFSGGTDSYNVVAPADGYVIDVGRFNGENDYRLILEHSCSLYTIFIHTRNLPEEISSQISWRGGGGYEWASARIPVTEGQVIGKAGGTSFDFSVHDSNVILEGFIFPEHYQREVWKIHTVDPFDYFEEPLASQLRDKSLRTAEPRGGRIDYDVQGTLAGNWFLEGTGWYGGEPPAYWSTHLSIVYDYIDPTQIRVSIGNFGGESKQFGVKGNSPDPSQVAEGETVKYELVGFDYQTPAGAWDRLHLAKGIYAENTGSVQGVALFQVLPDNKLKAEFFPGKTAIQAAGFTNQALTYER